MPKQRLLSITSQQHFLLALCTLESAIFHRAHQVVFLNELFNLGHDLDWAIIGAGVMPSDEQIRSCLSGQDYLTTVVAQDERNNTVQKRQNLPIFPRVRNKMPTEQLTEFNMDRWLDSYGEDVDLCEKMIHDYLKNRKALGVDNANFFNEFYSKPNVQRIQKGWINSYDNGIVFVEAGIADPSKAAKLIRSSDYLCAFFAFLEYMLQHVLEQEKLTNARSWAVCIYDMKNVSIFQWVNPLGPINRIFEARVALAMAYYAEMLSKVVIVNPPRLLNVLFKILSFLLPGRILNRFHIAHNLADIQKWICLDAIPVGFGGQKCVGNAALSTGYNTPRQFEDGDFLKVGTIWKQNSVLSVNYEHHTLKASEVFVRQFNVKKGQKLIYEFYANRNFVIKFVKENGDYLVPHFPKMCTPVLSEEGTIKVDENDHIKFELKNNSSIFWLKLQIAIMLID
uniref:CRAL-TRIO domain-containing protein n=1 Tax=Globodera rostochiensis TaxID=31243 RepID=A0A914GVI3_GLORO